MKVSLLLAALGVALAAPMPALAAEGAQHTGAGHYEWRSVPQHGPRATGQTQKRVWVPDNAQAASCECTMMKMNAAECMEDMPDTSSSSIKSSS